MDARDKTLYVQMFGGFSMRYGRRVISLNRERNSKSVRLLQMLLLSVPDGISKNELIDNLYGWSGGGESADYNNSLNVLIYRLKKQLTAAGLPNDNYIVIRNGICRFESRVPLETDVWQFERTMREAERNVGG